MKIEYWWDLPKNLANQVVLQSVRSLIFRNLTVKENNILTHFEQLKIPNKQDDLMIHVTLICCKSFYKSVLQRGIYMIASSLYCIYQVNMILYSSYFFLSQSL